jgi:hypothetical protein
MADLARRPGGGVTRKSREQRAFRMVVGGGTAAAVAVVGFVLALVGVIGYGVPMFAAVVAVVCWLVFRRTLS